MERELEPYQRVERSIQKKFRKSIWVPFIAAVKRYVNGEEKKFLSPFGYVYNADGGIDGNLLPLGGIYNLSGRTVAFVHPNGEMVNNNAVIGGRLTQYGYGVDEKNLILGKNIDVGP